MVEALIVPTFIENSLFGCFFSWWENSMFACRKTPISMCLNQIYFNISLHIFPIDWFNTRPILRSCVHCTWLWQTGCACSDKRVFIYWTRYRKWSSRSESQIKHYVIHIIEMKTWGYCRFIDLQLLDNDIVGPASATEVASSMCFVCLVQKQSPSLCLEWRIKSAWVNCLYAVC